MKAIIKAGSTQHNVAEGDKIWIETIAGSESGSVTFDQVLAVVNGSDAKFGAPTLSGVTVSGKILGTAKQKKIVTFKHKRRKNHRKKTGHRQVLMQVQIEKINA